MKETLQTGGRQELATGALGLSALLVTLTLLAALGLAWTTLAESAAHAGALTRVLALADAAARVAAVQQDDPAGRNAGLEAIEKPNAPLIAPIVVVHAGGVDEYGIEQSSQIVRGGADLPAPLRMAILDDVKGHSADAERALQKNQQLPGDKLTITLPGPQQAILLPFRAHADKPELAGAVVLRLQPQDPPQIPWHFWLLALPGVLLALQLRRRLGPKLGPTLGLAILAALGILLLPPLPPEPLTGIQLLADTWLVPHAKLATHAIAGQPWLLGLALGLTLLLGQMLSPLAEIFTALRRDPLPYAYVGPALVATGILVFVPFAVGVGLSFADRDGQFLGLGNYREVIETALDPHSATHFLRTLGMTILWTLVNVALHVTLGLTLALVLNQPKLKGRAIYRLLLIVPWAVPSYITALTWKWLFNTQYGPINSMLALCGVQKVDWLGDSVLTNFAANLATNVWLGFPFMMVVSLGALQSIPADLYEAAEIDGATSWQKFRHVTLPLLRPALFPAVIMGIIWTFNAFNVIYLVSGGGPDHKTDILITEAYYTFSVLRRHGLAAAYSVLIFALLLAYTLVTQRRTRATQGVAG